MKFECNVVCKFEVENMTLKDVIGGILIRHPANLGAIYKTRDALYVCMNYSMKSGK